MSTVYILALEHDKYYVGSTDNLEVRVDAHTRGTGALWTRLHKPINVLKVFRGCDAFDEDAYVKRYMKMYGIDNVRGGSYIFEKIDAETRKFIERELRHGSGECFKCGSTSHFAKECRSGKRTSPTKTSVETTSDVKVGTKDTTIGNGVEDTIVEDIEEVPPSPPTPPQPAIPKFRPSAFFQGVLTQQLKCGKCGKSGHLTEMCFIVAGDSDPCFKVVIPNDEKTKNFIQPSLYADEHLLKSASMSSVLPVFSMGLKSIADEVPGTSFPVQKNESTETETARPSASLQAVSSPPTAPVVSPSEDDIKNVDAATTPQTCKVM